MPIAVSRERGACSGRPQPDRNESRVVSRLIGFLLITGLLQAEPEIMRSPEAQAVQVGDEVVLLVEATGDNLSYVWTHNGTPVPGAAGSTLRIAAASQVDGGYYRVVVSDDTSSITTDPVRVQVGVSPASEGYGGLIANSPLFERADVAVYCVRPTSNGGLYVAGTFETWNGEYRGGLIRLHPDGSLDRTFQVTGVSVGWVFDMLVEPDGGVLVAGGVATEDNTRSGLIRFSKTGVVDRDFKVATLHGIRSMARFEDGRVIAVGVFDSYRGIDGTEVDLDGLVILEEDGRVDDSVGLPTIAFTTYGKLNSVAALEHGRFLVGGGFTAVNDVVATGLARINPDGSVDEAYTRAVNFGYSTTLPTISHLLPGGDGGTLVAGNFSTFDGEWVRQVVKLNANGEIDWDFNESMQDHVRAVRRLSTGPEETFVTGQENYDGTITLSFRNLDGSAASQLGGERTISLPGLETLCVSTQGSIWMGALAKDANEDSLASLEFDAAGNAAFTPFQLRRLGDVLTAEPAGDEDLWIGGRFDYVGGQGSQSVVRLRSDGSVVQTYDLRAVGIATVNALLPEPDGGVIVGGGFTVSSSEPGTGNHLVRIGSNGELDPVFGAVTSSAVYSGSVEEEVRDLARAPDGALWVWEDSGTLRRFAATGEQQSEYEVKWDSYSNSRASRIAIDDAGKVYVAGDNLKKVDSSIVRSVWRLSSDGSIDPDFDVPGFFNGVEDVAMSQNGNVLLAESEDYFSPQPLVVRLNADGTTDGGFRSVEATRMQGNKLLSLPNGRILVGGTDFFADDEFPSPYLARLNPDGSRDDRFVAAGLHDPVTAIALTDSGALFVGCERSRGSGFLQGVAGVAVTTKPVSQAVSRGGNVEFFVEAEGEGPLTYLWYHNGVPLPGATQPILELGDVQIDQLGSYQVEIRNAYGRLLSEPVHLISADPLPAISSVVGPSIVEAGQFASLVVTAEGEGLEYVWRRNGKVIPGATGATLNFDPVSQAHAGTYMVEVRQGLSSITSGPIRFNVEAPQVNGFWRVSRGSEEELLGRWEGLRQLEPGPEGTVYGRGLFDSVDGEQAANLIRFLPAGGLDTSFVPDLSPTAEVWDFVPMANGNLLVLVRDYSESRVLLLDKHGSVDASFVSPVLPGNAEFLDRWENGRIVVGGKFDPNEDYTEFRPAMVLNSDGSLDETFESPIVDGIVRVMLALRDGGVLIGGQFATVDETPVQSLARLNADGSRDSSFAADGGFEGQQVLFSMLQTRGGDILIGGGLTMYAGNSVADIISIDENGVLDTAFAAALKDKAYLVQNISPASDGGFWVSGDQNGGYPLVLKLSAAGGLEGELDLALRDVSNRIFDSLESGDGKLWLAPIKDGTPVARYDLGAERWVDLSAPALRAKQVVHVAVPAPGNSMFVGGDFDHARGVFTGPMAKLVESDQGQSGALPFGAHERGSVSAAIVQGDGEVVIGGAIFGRTQEPGTGPGLVRVLPDGSPDPAFANATINSGRLGDPFIYYKINDWTEYADGRIAITGGFSHQHSGGSYHNIARYSMDGALDTSFAAGRYWGHAGGYGMALDSQDRLYVGGDFSSWDGESHALVVRLEEDGALDEAFPDLGLSGRVHDLALDRSGRLLIAGAFTSDGQDPNRYLARYFSNGTLDPDFALDDRVGGPILGIALGHNGTIYAWSDYSLRSDRDDAYLIRLLPDGALDESFAVLGLTSGISSFGLRDDGRIFLGGWRPFPTGFLQPLGFGLPEIATGPVSKQIEAGTTAILAVEALGGELNYQWRRDGVAITGATQAALELSAVTQADAGFYDVVVTNELGSVTSRAIVVAVAPGGAEFAVGTQEQVGRGFTRGGTVVIRNTIAYSGELTSLSWATLVPTGWSFQSLEEESSLSATSTPTDGQTDLLEWNWSSVPESPFVVQYALVTPESPDRLLEIASLLTISRSGEEIQSLVTPDPLQVRDRSRLHDADTDADERLSLTELLRVIQLYNTRSGTTRTGRYRVDDAAADGFTPDAGDAGETLARHHSADTDRDGQLSLTELLRVIQLYNTRSGTTRTGAYRAREGTVDGFEPDS